MVTNSADKVDIMRVRLTLDGELVRKARELTGIQDMTDLVHEALKRLIQITAAHRLAALGGTMPEVEDIPRRRME